MPKIVFDQVEKLFDDTRVLSPFDLQLEDGEFTVLVGPSGCGKSTTLRILAGLESPSGGEIFFDDKPISHLEPKARDIAMVFQDYALYPHMNIAKNMSFALRLKRTPRKEINEKVERVAKMLNIEHLLKRKPAELSGGQRQRVAIARAVLANPRILILDEATSQVDGQTESLIHGELASFIRSRTTIIVTHRESSLCLADRVIVMRLGRIVSDSTVEEAVDGLVVRIIAGLVPACASLDDDAAAQMVERLTGVQTALAMLDHDARHREFPEVLAQLADRS